MGKPKEKDTEIEVGRAPTIHIKQEVIDGIRKALEDLYAAKGTSFHLSFPVGENETGDAHFTVAR